MNNQRWFYELLMEQFGPTTITNLLQLIQDRTLSQSDRVRPESSDCWITVADFRESFATEIEAATDNHRDETDHRDATDDGDETDDGRHAELDIDSFNLQGNSDPGQPLELSIDSFNLQGDSDSPKPANTRNRRLPVVEEPEPEPEPEEEDEATYYVRSLGHELGPLTQDEIVDMAKSGSFSQGDEIREGTQGNWISIESLTGQMEQRLSESPATDDVESEPVNETDSDSLAETPSAKAGRKNVRKKAAGSKAQRPTPAKRKKRKAKKDEFLQEIFAELFNEDGKLREDRIKETPAAAAAAGGLSEDSGDAVRHVPGQAAAAVSTVAAAGFSNTAASGVGQAMGAASGLYSAAVPGARPMPGAGASSQFAAPAPQFRPSKKSKGGGGGFEMPEPKVLGIIGGVLLVVLLIAAGFMGYLPASLGAPSGADLIKEFVEAHTKASAGPESAWKELEPKFGDRARSMARALAPYAAKDPKVKNEYNASLFMIKLISLPFAEEEQRTKVYAQFQKAATGR